MGEQAIWLREDRTVYALQHAGFRKGIEQFQNRWSFHVQGGPGSTPGELVAVARAAAAAPALIDALRTISAARAVVASVKAAPGAHTLVMSDGSLATGEVADVVLALIGTIKTMADHADVALSQATSQGSGEW
jgi:hypothetical protein